MGESFKIVERFFMMKNIWFIYSNVKFVKKTYVRKTLEECVE